MPRKTTVARTPAKFRKFTEIFHKASVPNNLVRGSEISQDLFRKVCGGWEAGQESRRGCGGLQVAKSMGNGVKKSMG